MYSTLISTAIEVERERSDKIAQRNIIFANICDNERLRQCFDVYTRYSILLMSYPLLLSNKTLLLQISRMLSRRILGIILMFAMISKDGSFTAIFSVLYLYNRHFL